MSLYIACPKTQTCTPKTDKQTNRSVYRVAAQLKSVIHPLCLRLNCWLYSRDWRRIIKIVWSEGGLAWRWWAGIISEYFHITTPTNLLLPDYIWCTRFRRRSYRHSCIVAPPRPNPLLLHTYVSVKNRINSKQLLCMFSSNIRKEKTRL